MYLSGFISLKLLANRTECVTMDVPNKEVLMKTILIHFGNDNIVNKIITNGEEVTINLLELALSNEGNQVEFEGINYLVEKHLAKPDNDGWIEEIHSVIGKPMEIAKKVSHQTEITVVLDHEGTITDAFTQGGAYDIIMIEDDLTSDPSLKCKFGDFSHQGSTACASDKLFLY